MDCLDTRKRYWIQVSSEVNIDSVVFRIEKTFGNEVIRVERFLDFLIVLSEDEKSLWVDGVTEVALDTDLT